MIKVIQIYFIPAAVFLSVLIGGGYGTGREVIEFFTQYGQMGGVLAICTATVIFAIVLGITFEFARVFKVYDYRHFFKKLIGPFWVVFEILYILLFLLVLGVVSAAAGNTLQERFDVPATIGLILMPILVALFVLFGRLVVEKALALWSVLMYGVFITYFVIVVGQSDTDLLAATALTDIEPSWWFGGALYAMYNLAIAPGLLFSTRDIVTRQQAFVSAAIAAVAIMIPALLFHLSYSVGYPDVLDKPLPNYWMIQQFAPDWLLMLFIIALFGTLIETGVGLVQSVIERTPATSDEANAKPWLRALIAFGTVSLAALLGTIGIVDLIGKGYSLMSYGFACVYVLPICTLGVYKVVKAGNGGALEMPLTEVQ
ncbi:hypothetical protein [Shewanella sp. 10N.286.52.B9]|uniref:YkvI family membrane protein n=1 Tax=Shewanella sp. 10N.286.52.B9 TaxID=1880837 RepID=UPI000C81EE2A|nr:hypothetical protein [Shewanella sp. 10N.286.52.B9]PMG48940.1 hypothetical protein BCU91_02820 [Shewanella sp. 10N.286.52.B9]